MSPAPHRPPWWLDITATMAVALYSLAVAAGFARVFSGWEFMSDLVILIIVGHGSSLVFRRLDLTSWIAIPITMVAVLWLTLYLHYGETMLRLLPTGATWDAIDLELGLVRDQFPTAVAPVLYGAGWAALASFAIAITVVMADAFAFRAEARGEALVPGGVLFVFIAALGTDRLRVTLTVALVAAGVLAVIALRSLHDRSRRAELSPAHRPIRLTAPVALATAIVVALLAGFVGPRLPGASAEPLYDTHGRDGGDVREIISPLVNIRSRLSSRTNVEVFRVNANAEAYWRVTTLPEFDGETFRLPARPLERVDGPFDTQSDDATTVRQRIQIVELDGALIPAAADPYEAEGFSGDEKLDLRLNRDTATLVSNEDLQPNDQFNVNSAAPDLTPAILDAATSDAPPDEIFTQLPDDIPDIVGETAAAVTASASTPYQQALAIQNWFRSEFKYSLEVQSGHGSSAIESFLNERVGYCEQFSATMAAMVRTLGIPSRVAVGFTPGVLDESGWYAVRDKNAHAWPEIWFDGIGWVAFEPTPSRGNPAAEQYTGVPAEQEPTAGTAGEGNGSGNTIVVPTAPSTIVPPVDDATSGAGPNATAPDNVFPNLPDGGFDEDFGNTTNTSTTDSTSTMWTWLAVIALLSIALVAPMLIRLYRRGTNRRHDPTTRALDAWVRACNAAEVAGVQASPSMTPSEWADATADQLPVAARPMRSLAVIVDRILFAPPGTVDLNRAGGFGTMYHDCELWSQQISNVADDQIGAGRRIQRYFTDLS